MVTILPIDIEEELMREGLQQAVALRARAELIALQKQVDELLAAGYANRESWASAFASLQLLYVETLPVLEYAKAFDDQHEDDNATSA